MTQQRAFLIAILRANLIDPDRAEKRGRVIATRGPLLSLPRGVTRSSLRDLGNRALRCTVGERLAVHEGGVEFTVCGAIGDAPGAQRVRQFLLCIDTRRVHIPSRLPATTAGCLRRNDAASRDRIRMIAEMRK